MQDNLAYGLASVAHDVRSVERRLIVELEPPLNLTDWRNPQKSLLQALREVCRQEARTGTAEGGLP
jgi:hypothetical protein